MSSPEDILGKGFHYLSHGIRRKIVAGLPDRVLFPRNYEALSPHEQKKVDGVRAVVATGDAYLDLAAKAYARTRGLAPTETEPTTPTSSLGEDAVDFSPPSVEVTTSSPALVEGIVEVSPIVEGS